MPQPKSSASRKSSGSRRGAAKAKAKPAAAKRGAAKAKAKPKKRSASKRSTGSRRAASSQGAAGTNVDAIRELLTRQLMRPLEVVMITRERMQEALDDAVSRGRLTRADAEDLVADLYKRGRKQTEDLIADVEQLLGRSREEFEERASVARRSARQTATRARKARPADRVLREVDRARRAARVGPTFPVIGYDDLSAAQISVRLTDLTKAELRKVRDHERRTAQRKSVLAAIEKRLK